MPRNPYKPTRRHQRWTAVLEGGVMVTVDARSANEAAARAELRTGRSCLLVDRSRRRRA